MNKLLKHFERMQDKMREFLEPGPYRELSGHASAGEHDYLAQGALFTGDMIYMLDGPEQREAQAEAEGRQIITEKTTVTRIGNVEEIVTRRIYREPSQDDDVPHEFLAFNPTEAEAELYGAKALEPIATNRETQGQVAAILLQREADKFHKDKITITPYEPSVGRNNEINSCPRCNADPGSMHAWTCPIRVAAHSDSPKVG